MRALVTGMTAIAGASAALGAGMAKPTARLDPEFGPLGETLRHCHVVLCEVEGLVRSVEGKLSGYKPCEATPATEQEPPIDQSAAALKRRLEGVVKLLVEINNKL